MADTSEKTVYNIGFRPEGGYNQSYLTTAALVFLGFLILFTIQVYGLEWAYKKNNHMLERLMYSIGMIGMMLLIVNPIFQYVQDWISLRGWGELAAYSVHALVGGGLAFVALTIASGIRDLSPEGTLTHRFGILPAEAGKAGNMA